jgi:hypothetical protein
MSGWTIIEIWGNVNNILNLYKKEAHHLQNMCGGISVMGLFTATAVLVSI